jgi:GR25 family glycosyltransferase involved in LPS biosynthesis
MKKQFATYSFDNHMMINASTPYTMKYKLSFDTGTGKTYCTPIELACLESHLRAIDIGCNGNLQEKENDWIFICEDDIVFERDISKIQELVDKAPADAECLQLYIAKTLY